MNQADILVTIELETSMLNESLIFLLCRTLQLKKDVPPSAFRLRR